MKKLLNDPNAYVDEMLEGLCAAHPQYFPSAMTSPARAAAKAALEAALTEFRGRENKIGRARIFAERSRGLDDPGMIAARHMLESVG